MQTYDSFNALATANAAPLVSDMSVFNAAGTDSTDTSTSNAASPEIIDGLLKALTDVHEWLMRGTDKGWAPSVHKTVQEGRSTLYSAARQIHDAMNSFKLAKKQYQRYQRSGVSEVSAEGAEGAV